MCSERSVQATPLPTYSVTPVRSQWCSTHRLRSTTTPAPASASPLPLLPPLPRCFSRIRHTRERERTTRQSSAFDRNRERNRRGRRRWRNSFVSHEGARAGGRGERRRLTTTTTMMMMMRCRQAERHTGILGISYALRLDRYTIPPRHVAQERISVSFTCSAPTQSPGQV